MSIGSRRLRQIHHSRINSPVRVEREIVNAEVLSRLVVSKVVEQDGAENGALRFHIRRQRADGVIGSGQGISLSESLDCGVPNILATTL